MAYTKTNWENAPSTNTPVNAENLNHIEQGIYDNSNNIGDLSDLTTTYKTDLVNAVNEVNQSNTYSSTETNTGKKWKNGKTIYRIALEITGLTIGTDYVKTFATYNISNVEDIVKLEGYEYGDTYFIPLLSYNAFNNYLFTQGTNIKFKVGFTNSVRIIMEYTKSS